MREPYLCLWLRALPRPSSVLAALSSGGAHTSHDAHARLAGLFSNKPGEKPPWYLNPLITFPAIFAIVGLGFYLVVALDGIHRGEVPIRGDDLSDFIGETVAP